MFAPVISLSLVLDVVADLFPIANGGKLPLARHACLPEVQQHRLTRLGSETRQWRYGTIRIANVLAESDDIVVLFDERTDVVVPLDKSNFVDDGVGAYIYEAADLEPFFRKSCCPRDPQYRVRMGEQLLRLAAGQAKPFLI